MASFNLLPDYLAPKGKYVKAANLIKRITLIGTVVLVIGIVAMLSAFYLISGQLKSSLAREEELKAVIKSLEDTERKIVLIRDRIGKVEGILAAPNASQQLTGFDEIVAYMPSEVGLVGANLTEVDTTTSLTAANSSSISEFFSRLVTSSSFRQIDLTNFNFRQDQGFTMDLTFKSK